MIFEESASHPMSGRELGLLQVLWCEALPVVENVVWASISEAGTWQTVCFSNISKTKDLYLRQSELSPGHGVRSTLLLQCL